MSDVVSIPFIAGQWSLPLTSERSLTCLGKFQSPSLRGSGRFEATADEAARDQLFQSPSLRGSGRFTKKGGSRGCSSSRFNPLHCGAVIASPMIWRT